MCDVEGPQLERVCPRVRTRGVLADGAAVRDKELHDDSQVDPSRECPDTCLGVDGEPQKDKSAEIA